MRVDVKQIEEFADHFVEIPETELNLLDELIDREVVSKILAAIEINYDPVSMFKMMKLQTWHNLPDGRFTKIKKSTDGEGIGTEIRFIKPRESTSNGFF